MTSVGAKSAFFRLGYRQLVDNRLSRFRQRLAASMQYCRGQAIKEVLRHDPAIQGSLLMASDLLWLHSTVAEEEIPQATSLTPAHLSTLPPPADSPVKQQVDETRKPLEPLFPPLDPLELQLRRIQRRKNVWPGARKPGSIPWHWPYESTGKLSEAEGAQEPPSLPQSQKQPVVPWKLTSPPPVGQRRVSQRQVDFPVAYKLPERHWRLFHRSFKTEAFWPRQYPIRPLSSFAVPEKPRKVSLDTRRVLARDWGPFEKHILPSSNGDANDLLLLTKRLLTLATILTFCSLW
ncbi:hypothetical protein RUND412_000231 [Rhizina undulata]